MAKTKLIHIAACTLVGAIVDKDTGERFTLLPGEEVDAKARKALGINKADELAPLLDRGHIIEVSARASSDASTETESEATKRADAAEAKVAELEKANDALEKKVGTLEKQLDEATKPSDK